MTSGEFFMRLAVAIYKMDGAYDRFAKGSGVKANLLWLLYALNDGNPHTQRQICDEWYFPRSTVNTLIKECEEKGYVTLHRLEGERREMEIRLTETGQMFAQGVLTPVYRAEEELFRTYFAEKSCAFLQELEAFGETMERVYSRQDGCNEKTEKGI